MGNGLTIAVRWASLVDTAHCVVRAYNERRISVAVVILLLVTPISQAASVSLLSQIVGATAVHYLTEVQRAVHVSVTGIQRASKVEEIRRVEKPGEYP